MTANLHVALSMAVDCQPSASDAQLIDRVYGMRAELARLRDQLGQPTLERNLRPARDQPKVTAKPSPQLELEEVA